MPKRTPKEMYCAYELVSNCEFKCVFRDCVHVIAAFAEAVRREAKKETAELVIIAIREKWDPAFLLQIMLAVVDSSNEFEAATAQQKQDWLDKNRERVIIHVEDHAKKDI